MAVTHVAATRNNLANQILTDIGTSGKLVIMTSGDVEVATLPLSATAGTVTGAVLTFNAITSDTNCTGGTAALFKVETSAAAEVFRGSVGTSGSDLNFAAGVTFTAGDTVEVTSFTYTAPL